MAPPKKMMKLKKTTHTMVVDGNLVLMSGSKHSKSSKIIRVISKAKSKTRAAY